MKKNHDKAKVKSEKAEEGVGVIVE